MKSKNTFNTSSILSLLLLGALLLLVVAALGISQQAMQNNAPKNSGAIFGGRLESGYEFAGYLISDLGETLKICSAVLISPTQAVTAAHCLDNNAPKFVGLGEYTSDRSQYINVKEVILDTNWQNHKKVENDIGLIILETPVGLSQYAQLEAPTKGCNYVVVGYGKQDDSESFTPLRKSTDICIENTNYLGNAISFTGKEGGLCFGDSGSGIFEANTNKFITIASSIDSCYINNFGAGAKVAGKIDILSSTISDKAGNKKKCGYIDTQNNKVVDEDDIKEFVNNYLESCSDSTLIDQETQCGPKDINLDFIIDLEDLSKFAEIYKAGKCN